VQNSPFRVQRYAELISAAARSYDDHRAVHSCLDRKAAESFVSQRDIPIAVQRTISCRHVAVLLKIENGERFFLATRVIVE
jgi:hypothetical protein